MCAYRNRITGEVVEDEPKDHVIGLWQVGEPGWKYNIPSIMTAARARKQELERSCLLEIGTLAESGRKQGWKEWVQVPTILPSRAVRVQLTPFEILIDQRLQHLQEVCRSPRMHLTTEIEKVRASSARRVPMKACEYLAAHSEDWQQRSFRSIRPRRVLSLLVEDLFDIYENRVMVRLTDHLLEYLDDRLKELRKLTGVINEAKRYQEQCEGYFWRKRRLFTEFGRLYTDQEHDRAVNTIHFLEALERKLLALCASDLYKAIPRRAQVLLSLRETNILANDQHYRHVAHLWRAWAEWYQNRVRTRAQVREESERVCLAFEEYSTLLITKSLASLGFIASADVSPIPRSALVRIVGPWGGLVLAWNDDGSIRITSEEWDNSLRFIPIPDLITATNDALDEVERKFLCIARDAKSRHDETLVFLYPGSELERRRIPFPLRRRLHALWSERLPDDNFPLSILGVGPMVIDSVEEVARAINIWRAEKQLEQFPPTLQHSDRTVIQCLANYSSALAPAGTNAIQIRRPLLNHEWTLLESKFRQERASGRRGNPLFSEETVDTVLEGLLNVSSWFDRALSCPVCSKAAEPRVFQPLDRNTYRITCNACQSTWGLRPCSCGKAYPFLQLHVSVSIHQNLDQTLRHPLGRDVFAVPCSVGVAEAFICPHCGNCGKFNSRLDNCTRCRQGMDLGA
jgi:hypothetical protein